MAEPGQHRWVVLYQSALLELDRSKILERIRKAEEAIQERLQETTTGITLTAAERMQIHDALRNLRVLAKELV